MRATAARSNVAGGELVTRKSVARGPRRPWSYDWPVKPFGRQHPVRGFFNDPRIGGHGSHAFHFGIDIAAPDGTPVYAIRAGKVFYDSGRALAVLEPNGHSFGYWHIVPAVASHSYVGRHHLLGHIDAGWGHVHLAERMGGAYVNPLRPGALGPYADHVPPTIDEVGLAPSRGGTVDVIASAYDMPQPRVPGKWADEPVTPAVLRWRVVKDGRPVLRWRTSVDFRSAMLPAWRYRSIYAPGTDQNREGAPGRYCFYLRTMWPVSRLAPGAYVLQVSASDTVGNEDLATLPLRIS